MDEEGIVPEALDELCKQQKIRGLYTIPTLQNPTVTVQSHRRRRHLSEVIERHNLWLIEDDVVGPLMTSAPPPLQFYLPHKTFYIANLSKIFAYGLRLSYLVCPPAHRAALSHTIQATVWRPSPIGTEIATTLIEANRDQEILSMRRTACAERHNMAQKTLRNFALKSHPSAYHTWLPLPQGWRAETFVSEAKKRGVLVTAAEDFAVEARFSTSAVRLCLGGARELKSLQQALNVIHDLLQQGPMALDETGQPVVSQALGKH